MDLYQVNLLLHISLLNSPIHFNPTPIILEAAFNQILSILRMYLR